MRYEYTLACVCAMAGTDHYTTMTNTQQDSFLPLSGPSDPSSPHLVQRRPQVQQVTPLSLGHFLWLTFSLLLCLSLHPEQGRAAAHAVYKSA